MSLLRRLLLEAGRRAAQNPELRRGAARIAGEVYGKVAPTVENAGRHEEGLPLERVHDDLMPDGRLPYADGSVDAVVLPQVLEHMPDPERVLDEALRVLRPGGHAVVSVRNLDSAYGRHWQAEESRAQVPNQGPFRPLPAETVRAWLTARFATEHEIGVGRDASHDAAVLSGSELLGGRLYAVRCRRD